MPKTGAEFIPDKQKTEKQESSDKISQKFEDEKMMETTQSG